MTPTLMLASLLWLPAADPTPNRLAEADDRIHQYLASEVARLSKNVLNGAKTKEQWQNKRPKLKQQFLDMLGLWPLPEKTPLKPTITGTLDMGDYAVDMLHFQSRPGLYVTGNLYRPNEKATTAGGSAKKYPAILYVCGHAGKGRDGNKTAYQDHGKWYASNGYICLIVDTLQLGEVAGIHHGTYSQNRFWWHSRGYTPAGVECWNGIRAIDYLCSRPDVDPEAVGVTGRSGGGATTVWIAAADDRVKAAMPVSGLSDLQSYVTDQVINGHCDCMFGYNIYQWEWTTILSLFAPKPLLFANSDSDRIFPMDGNRRVIQRLRKLYAMLGEKEKVDEFVTPGAHKDGPELQAASFAFFNEYLRGKPGAVPAPQYEPIEGKKLRVFPEDGDLPKDAINAVADETFVPVAKVELPATPEEFAAWRADLLKRMKERSFRSVPEKSQGGNPIGDEVNGRLPWRTFAGPVVTVVNLCAGTDLQDNLVVLNEKETVEDAAKFWTKQGGVDRRAIGIYPRGTGLDVWTRKNPPNTVERSFVLLGQTADTGRVRDVMSYLVGDPRENPKYRLCGRGPAGVIAVYAALLAPGTVDEVVLIDPPTSHRDGPHFLGIQRTLDIPEAIGLLAPDVKVTIISTKETQPFEKSAAIFKLAGAEKKLQIIKARQGEPQPSGGK